jgi:serine dehydrogenase proteinase
MPNWANVLREIQKETDELNESASDKVRKKYLMQLNAHHGRNVICYYSGWLSKPSNIQGLEINDDDKNGFMLCIHGMDRSKGLDLFLHTPGGSGAATESLVHYLKQMFGNDIRAFVPQIAMSAGTMIACACKEIFLGKPSNLGPVDPQVNGLHAYAVIEQLRMAYNEIIADNSKAWVWNPILANYTPGFVQQCEWAIKKTKDLVGAYLRENMFSGRPNASALADQVVEWLTELSKDKGHDHHIHYDECQKNNLEIRILEDPNDRKLQDLVLTVHHCYMYTLSNTGAFKIIESHVGRRYIKIQQQMLVQHMPFVTPPAAGAPSLAPGGPTS